MLKLEISDPTVTTRTGNKDGRQWALRSQVGWIHFPERPYPLEVEIQLKDDQPPHAKGVYTINWSKSVFVNRYKRLELVRSPALEVQK